MDEYGTSSSDTLAQLLDWTKSNPNMIIQFYGDPNQNGAIEEPTFDLSQTNLFCEIMKSKNAVHFTKEFLKEKSRYPLKYYNIWNKFLKTGRLNHWKDWKCLQYNEQKDFRDSLHIVFTNKLRKDINKKLNGGTLVIKKNSPIISKHNKIVDDVLVCKGERFICKDVNDEVLTIEKNKKLLELSIDHFDLAYAITGHNIQGDDVERKFVIHEGHKQYVTLNWLYTVATRPKAKTMKQIAENVRFANLSEIINRKYRYIHSLHKKPQRITSKQSNSKWSPPEEYELYERWGFPRGENEQHFYRGQCKVKYDKQGKITWDHHKRRENHHIKLEDAQYELLGKIFTGNERTMRNEETRWIQDLVYYHGIDKVLNTDDMGDLPDEYLPITRTSVKNNKDYVYNKFKQFLLDTYYISVHKKGEIYGKGLPNAKQQVPTKKKPATQIKKELKRKFVRHFQNFGIQVSAKEIQVKA